MRRFLPLILLLVCFLAGCSSTKVMVSSPHSGSGTPLPVKMEASGITPITLDKPTVWRNGNDWMRHLTSLVSGAKKYVILTSFLASNSDEVAFLYEAIVKKAEEGIPVYFLVDGIGLFDMTESRFHLVPLLYLNDTPVHFLEFSPLSTARLISGTDMVYRYHQKVIIIDGEVMAVGGMNLNYISIGASGKALQRDSMYEFSSPEAIQAFIAWFVPWWNDHSWDRIPSDAFPVNAEYRKEERNLTGWFVNGIPSENEAVSSAYAALISSAKKSIEILPFLPAMDGNMKEAIKNAIDRGVEVSMVISYDPRTADRYMYEPLLELGVKMRIETEATDLGLLHEKLMVVDDRYVLCGSSNFNVRSMDLSYESCLVVDSTELAGECHDHFSTLFENATEVSLEDARKWHTFGKYLMHLLMTVGG
jgi:cardiolipin synthase